MNYSVISTPPSQLRGIVRLSDVRFVSLARQRPRVHYVDFTGKCCAAGVGSSYESRNTSPSNLRVGGKLHQRPQQYNTVLHTKQYWSGDVPMVDGVHDQSSNTS